MGIEAPVARQTLQTHKRQLAQFIHAEGPQFLIDGPRNVIKQSAKRGSRVRTRCPALGTVRQTLVIIRAQQNIV